MEFISYLYIRSLFDLGDETALSIAIENGNVEICDYLIKNGANLNVILAIHHILIMKFIIISLYSLLIFGILYNFI